MQKAKLTGGQVVAAIFAGIIGHVFFAAGWIALGFILLGGLLTAVLGGAIGSLTGLFDSETVDAVMGGAGGVVGGLVIGLGIGAVVIMALGVLFSWLILRAGKVRKPAATTWTSVIVVAILSLPLLLVYGAIAGNAADGQPRFTIVAIIGTVVVGVLVWLWMTWAHRGPASEFAEQKATATGTAAVAPAKPAPAVEAAPAEPVATVKAPVKAPATAKAPVAKAPPKKPTQ
jgi:hypothetical protein